MRPAQDRVRGDQAMTLPQLHLADWRPAKDTPHLYSQIVGKIRLAAGREGGRLIGCRTQTQTRHLRWWPMPSPMGWLLQGRWCTKPSVLQVTASGGLDVPPVFRANIKPGWRTPVG